MSLSIVVPCYNEAKNIPLILERFASVIGDLGIVVVLVDNGSTDNSADILDELLPNYDFAKKVSVEVNQGYGFGILSGLDSCTTEYLGWTHADMQTDPADVIKAYNIIKTTDSSNNVYVKGDRKGRPAFDQLFTIGMSLFETVYLQSRLWDINAQPNIFHKSFFQRIRAAAPYDFSLDLYVLYMARKYNLTIKRFSVIFPERIHGSSSWNDGFASKWKFIKRTIEFSLKLKKGL